jgi:hypothetical protein
MVPFLVIAVLKLIPFLCVTFFSHPLIARLSIPLVQSVFGEEALHYPQHVFMLGNMYRVIDIAVLALFGSTMFGWAVFMMTDALQSRRVAATRYGTQVVSSLPALLLIGSLLVTLIFGIPLLFEQLARTVQHERLLQLLNLAAIGLLTTTTSIFVYAPFFIAPPSPKALRAIRQSIRFAKTRFEVTALAVLTALAIHACGQYFVARLLTPHAGGPDPLLQAIVVRLLFDTVAAYYLFAATTSLAVRTKAR